jgi:hypothetical protein
MLMSMLQAHPGDMDFLNTIFGFLQRRTGCFNGPKVCTQASTWMHIRKRVAGRPCYASMLPFPGIFRGKGVMLFALKGMVSWRKKKVDLM